MPLGAHRHFLRYLHRRRPLRHYCTLLYSTTRNYSQVAEWLGVDRRTVRAKVDEALLGEL
jgi:hypothetical protein